jgi:hypothetical protein
MNRLNVAWSVVPDAQKAVEECASQLGKDAFESAGLVVVQYSSAYEAHEVRAQIAQRTDAPLFGASTCLGVMTSEGFHTQDGSGLGVLLFPRDIGTMASAGAALGDAPEGAAKEALSQAIVKAGRPGESPSLVWVSSAPGQEEAVLNGIRDMVGPSVPVVGGSSADNAVEGKWSQFSREAEFQDGIVVAALFLKNGFSSVFQSGYEPTSHRARVTEVKKGTYSPKPPWHLWVVPLKPTAPIPSSYSSIPNESPRNTPWDFLPMLKKVRSWCS